MEDFGVLLATELALTWIRCPDWCFERDPCCEVRRKDEQRMGHRQVLSQEITKPASLLISNFDHDVHADF